ncbi:MAG: hypothetical protein FWE20_09080 [Defluviitaleaceae bacterium]|nr:hypothetical protein [Defluviitaleaceae bacterium]
MFLPHLPQIDRARWIVRGSHGVCYVKHISDLRVTACLVDKPDAFRAARNPAVELFVPHLKGRAGYRVLALGVYQKLFRECVLVQLRRRAQKACPTAAICRNVRRGLVCQG